MIFTRARPNVRKISASCKIYQRNESSTCTTRLELQTIDRKWQQRWQNAASPLKTTPTSKKYILSMFPYPSGALHMGHLRVYTIADVMARFYRMKGHQVLFPMGWDAFGLPAENAAIERGIDPATWTHSNIAKMKEQLMAMNGSFDWECEFMTCDPRFYKHTQHIFLMMLERGLAYQADSLVNFDPIDQTVLANEQVDANGHSWRSGAKVEKIHLKQWFLRVTAFKEELLQDLEVLRENGWPERVLAMQQNWLGKSDGANLRFAINEAEFIDVFTTRPDTLFGVQYLALSASHPLVIRQAAYDVGLQRFLSEIPILPTESKIGFRLDLQASNPLLGLPSSELSKLSKLSSEPSEPSSEPSKPSSQLPISKLPTSKLPTLEPSEPRSSWNQPIPVFVAPYVLPDHGKGAVMGVPGHDVRDWRFWKENGDGFARPVIESLDKSARDSPTKEAPYTGHGVLMPSCGGYAGMDSKAAGIRIVSDLTRAGNLAEAAQTWKLRDWLISRQRYWGTPIPIIHCQTCGAVPVPVEELPVKLPDLSGDWSDRRRGNPLEAAEEWLHTKCPKCNGPAKRETDTMDTFVDSSWYFMRFPDSKNEQLPFSAIVANEFLPVDVYIGGIEHAILHLLYARFVSKFIARTLWPDGPAHHGEPFTKLISQGMVHGKTFSDPQSSRFLRPDEIELRADGPKLASGESPVISFEKMSKSKYNGVDPVECIQRYGADVVRAHILFQAPVTEVLEWDESSITGIQRWFARIWRISRSVDSLEAVPLDLPSQSQLTSDEATLWTTLQQTITSVTQAYAQTQALNTAISDLIKLTNAILALPSDQPNFEALRSSALSDLLCMLAPIAPAFTSECWEHLHGPDLNRGDGSILASSFPQAKQFTMTTQACAVQENGKLRFVVHIPKPLNIDPTDLKPWVLKELRNTAEGTKWLHEKQMDEWKKVVVVRGGKTINFVR